MFSATYTSTTFQFRAMLSHREVHRRDNVTIKGKVIENTSTKVDKYACAYCGWLVRSAVQRGSGRPVASGLAAGDGGVMVQGL